jgi:hypothetical protein
MADIFRMVFALLLYENMSCERTIRYIQLNFGLFSNFLMRNVEKNNIFFLDHSNLGLSYKFLVQICQVLIFLVIKANRQADFWCDWYFFAGDDQEKILLSFLDHNFWKKNMSKHCVRVVRKTRKGFFLIHAAKNNQINKQRQTKNQPSSLYKTKNVSTWYLSNLKFI